ncbi:hypothetical protein K7432_014394 [Basidiobolus ranarum]|uniref:Uncharacterized protein n=1 Tax=Basidiobolus ranarum TaxID=34480 RepID=A0ABR2VPK7_9FUNG
MKFIASTIAVIAAIAVSTQAASVEFHGCQGQYSLQQLKPHSCYPTRDWRKTSLCRVANTSGGWCYLYSDTECQNLVDGAVGGNIDTRKIRANNSILCW